MSRKSYTVHSPNLQDAFPKKTDGDAWRVIMNWTSNERLYQGEHLEIDTDKPKFQNAQKTKDKRQKTKR